MSSTHPVHFVRACVDSIEGFRGNSAAVVCVDVLPSAAIMQSIAADLRQPATTFIAIAPEPARYDGLLQIRRSDFVDMVAWLRPPSCRDWVWRPIVSTSARERSISSKKGSGTAFIWMESPVGNQVIPEGLAEAFGVELLEHHANDNKHLLVVKDEETVQQARPDYAALRQFETFGWVLTAPGDEVDFVSRTFVPHVAELEDAATGSSHTALTPFWSERLGKNEMRAHQLSARGGKFMCRVHGGQVQLLAECEVYGEGIISF